MKKLQKFPYGFNIVSNNIIWQNHPKTNRQPKKRWSIQFLSGSFSDIEEDTGHVDHKFFASVAGSRAWASDTGRGAAHHFILSFSCFLYFITRAIIQRDIVIQWCLQALISRIVPRGGAESFPSVPTEMT